MGRSTAQARNNIFVQWIRQHPPFVGYATDHILSAYLGIIADTSVNCGSEQYTSLSVVKCNI